MPDAAAGPLPGWAEVARPIKLMYLSRSEGGELPPVVFARKAGRVLAVVVAPEVDKDLGLDACLALRRALDPDELVMAMDAHVYRGKSEADYERARATWPGGRMQAACDEQGACAAGRLMDCLQVLRIDRGGRLAAATMGYHYHGASGPPFRWDESPFWAEEGPDSAAMGGDVVAALRRIMRAPTILDEARLDPAAARVIRKLIRRDPGRLERIAAATCLETLAERDYLVIGAGGCR